MDILGIKVGVYRPDDRCGYCGERLGTGMVMHDIERGVYMHGSFTAKDIDEGSPRLLAPDKPGEVTKSSDELTRPYCCAVAHILEHNLFRGETVRLERAAMIRLPYGEESAGCTEPSPEMA